MSRIIGTNVESLVYPPGSKVICGINIGDIQLGEGSTVNVTQNIGRLYLGSLCIIEGESFWNSGKVVTGDQCIITKLKENFGKITLGSSCTIIKLKENFGKITLGSSCTVLSAGRNTGKIILGPNCHLPQFSRHSVGTVVPYNNNLNIAFAPPPPPPVAIYNPPVNHWNPVTGEEPQYLQIQCDICLLRPKNMAFQCGHTFCIQCGEAVYNCPICRAPVQQRIKLYN